MKGKVLHFKSALNVSEGVPQPPSINTDAVHKLKKRNRTIPSSTEFLEGIRAGNRVFLSQAITMVESSLPEHNELAQKIIESCLPYTGNSIRLGITGVPGAGKSTFIESFGEYLTKLGKKIAVLAIDPSSEKSKGSILGDKTRMEMLSVNENAFIRPSPSAGTLGGVARKTRESVFLCEAAGFDVILIETVGVGQSETAVHSMVDFFLLLMLAGAGDELQGIKRGIMEMANAIVITKADSGNQKKCDFAKKQYENALHLYPINESGWAPKVQTCSALENKGIDEVWDTVMEYFETTKQNGYFKQNRRNQSTYWMHETINSALMGSFYNNPAIDHEINDLKTAVLNDKITSFAAARKLLDRYFGKKEI